MEPAFQSGFASVLLDVLTKNVIQVVMAEVKMFVQSDEALGQLELTFLKIQKVLSQVDIFEIEGSRAQRVRQDWVNELSKVLYEADDLMKDIELIIDPYSGLCHKPVCKAIVRSPGQWAVPRAITKLQTKLDKMLNKWNDLENLTSNTPSTLASEMIDSSNQSKHDPIIPIVGREDDVKRITQLLLSGSSEKVGVSIIGIDGLGKTTLARTIQNEASITAHFSVILWVDVDGGVFNQYKILQMWDDCEKNVRSDKNNSPSKNNDAALIILDNLQKVPVGDWGNMWEYIRQKKINGNKYNNFRFLITTFNSEVVANTRTSFYYLQPLCDIDSSKVIAAMAEHLNPPLFESHPHERIVQNLAEYSGGLPPVARVLGSLFGQHGVEKVDSYLKDSWNSDVFQKEIFPSLKPCYSKIQSHLMPHFAYFSLFPDNYSFTVDELPHLWAGEGFIQDETSSKLIQEGEKHFNEFRGLTILLDSADNTWNEMAPPSNKMAASYKLNKVSYKFAQMAASKTCLKLTKGTSTIDTNTFHLSLCYTDNRPTQWDKLKKLENLRTLLALLNCNIGEIPCSIIKKLTRLRVLSLSGSNVKELPKNINCLTSLRYLDISDTAIVSLPSSLCKLGALQFLKLAKIYGGLNSLPKNFGSLTNLIYIDWDISDISNMKGLPPNIGNLTSLQRLPLFPVQNKDGYRISELKNMKHLQGSIRIDNLENVDNWASCKVAQLHEKSFRRVELEWKKARSSKLAKDVLSCLKPSENLKELKITNYHGDEFPEWMTSLLPELERMELHRCPEIEVLPEVGKLPSLKFLFFEEMTKVTHVDGLFFGGGHFLMLEELVFMDMEQLQEWIMGSASNVMPRLKVLTFSSCPKLVRISSLKHLSSLKELTIQRCEAMSSLPLLPISLEKLKVEECDLLTNSCKEGSEDWTKFDHVQDVQIGYLTIRSPAIQPSCPSDTIPTSPPGEDKISSNELLFDNFGLRGYQVLKSFTRAMPRLFHLKNYVCFFIVFFIFYIFTVTIVPNYPLFWHLLSHSSSQDLSKLNQPK